jgi:PPOX class probable FMN-dependent enzyme
MMANDTTALRQRFRDVVASEAELRTIVREPSHLALDKVVRVLDRHSRSFIAHAPFVFIASAGAGGMVDVSPKGDPAGFVKVLDDHTLAIPDRLGNGRLDTLRNILGNPHVGLIFIIPGVGYTLRISGRANIVRDRELRESLTVNRKLPDHVLVVAVDHVLSHCPKCMIRSGMWKPESWPDVSDLPTLAETLVAHAKIAESVGEIQAIIDQNIREELY